MKISLLGTDYDLKICAREDDPKLDANPDIEGYTDFTTKKIVVVDQVKEAEEEDANDIMDDLGSIVKRIIRHELAHIMFFESGLDSSSSFARDEELIDFLAIQFHKYKAACEQAEKFYDSYEKKGKA